MLTGTMTRLWHTITCFNLHQADDVTPTSFSDTSTRRISFSSEAGKRLDLTYRLYHSRLNRRSAPGTEEARPVFVLVHGIGMSHRYFDQLQAELMLHGDTVMLDLPGFGGTPTPDGRLSVSDYAAVIADAVEALDLTSCVLVGHSMGAQFVTELAVQRPDLVSAVVLIGPVTNTAYPSARRNAAALAVDTLLERPVTNLLVGAAYIRCGIRWYLTELPVMLGYRLDDRLAGVTQPVLVLRGSLDVIAGRAWCQRLAQIAPNGRVVEIPGQPHAAHRGAAPFTASAIIDLIAGVPDLPRSGGHGTQIDAGGDHSPTRPTSRDSSPVLSWRTAGSATPAEPSTGIVPQWLGITSGDRQCRAHIIEHQPEHQDRAHTPRGTALASDPDPVPVFLLIHGIGMSHRYFLRLGQRLSRRGRVLLIDLPGYGWTRRPDRKATNPANAELIATLLDEMGVSSCTVVGHSMGVQTATELAIQRPDLVSHVVLIGAAVDARRRTVPQQALTLGLNSILEKPVLNTVQFLDVLRCGPRWYLSELAVAMDYRLEERLPHVTQPVLVLRGSRDLVAGNRWSRSLADSSRNGVLTVVAGAPHGVHHSSPDVVAAHIISLSAPLDPAAQHRHY